jgi:hypothetical protein
VSLFWHLNELVCIHPCAGMTGLDGTCPHCGPIALWNRGGVGRHFPIASEPAADTDDSGRSAVWQAFCFWLTSLTPEVGGLVGCAVGLACGDEGPRGGDPGVLRLGGTGIGRVLRVQRAGACRGVGQHGGHHLEACGTVMGGLFDAG